VNFLYNVLFIQNFVPDAVAGNFNQECAAWMWYLAVDFQLHLLLPGVMIAYVINSRMGWAVVVALFTISFGTSIWLVDNHNLSSQVLKATTGLHGNYQDEFYTKPHTRAPALLLGVALAVSLLMREQHGPAALQSMAPALHSGLSRAAQLARWILPSTVNTTGATLKHQTPDLIATSTLVATMSLLGFLYYIPVTNYSADNATGWSRSAAITYTILSRPAWAAALAVFLYLCCTKRGGALGWLLSLQIWLPLSRLAFALYLAHPIVIFYFMGSEVAPARYAAAWVASAYTRNLLVTYVLAALLYLFVEAPAAALLRNVSQSVARTGTGAGTASSKRVVSRGINY
jgi:peptidoglycan/LPS O-acetylase OafA/YrhL